MTIDELIYSAERGGKLRIITTSYLDLSNLLNVVISSGLEWNGKVIAKDLLYTIKKIEAAFENYWNSTEFEFYENNIPSISLSEQSGEEERNITKQKLINGILVLFLL